MRFSSPNRNESPAFELSPTFGGLGMQPASNQTHPFEMNNSRAGNGGGIHNVMGLPGMGGVGGGGYQGMR